MGQVACTSDIQWTPAPHTSPKIRICSMADPAAQLSALQKQLEIIKIQLHHTQSPGVRLNLVQAYHSLLHRINQLLDIINYQIDGRSRALMPPPKIIPKRK